MLSIHAVSLAGNTVWGPAEMTITTHVHELVGLVAAAMQEHPAAVQLLHDSTLLDRSATLGDAGVQSGTALTVVTDLGRAFSRLVTKLDMEAGKEDRKVIDEVHSRAVDSSEGKGRVLEELTALLNACRSHGHVLQSEDGCFDMWESTLYGRPPGVFYLSTNREMINIPCHLTAEIVQMTFVDLDGVLSACIPFGGWGDACRLQNKLCWPGPGSIWYASHVAPEIGGLDGSIESLQKLAESNEDRPDLQNPFQVTKPTCISSSVLHFFSEWADSGVCPLAKLKAPH
ncbi:unnamed protein product [Polarella glacialis]|uniref:Ubiquitin-like domain-containing protein n=1 Tax=Polarella glacialis TaxID=89957 RepID=A0A813F5Q0_POLGL|nr:unnamed protein product [Polarella glacialis]